MSKLLSVLIVGCSVIGIATAHAGGCRIGIHSGAYSGCGTFYGDSNYGGGY